MNKIFLTKFNKKKYCHVINYKNIKNHKKWILRTFRDVRLFFKKFFLIDKIVRPFKRSYDIDDFK